MTIQFKTTHKDGVVFDGVVLLRACVPAHYFNWEHDSRAHPGFDKQAYVLDKLSHSGRHMESCHDVVGDDGVAVVAYELSWEFVPAEWVSAKRFLSLWAGEAPEMGFPAWREDRLPVEARV